ncbi:glutathione synthase/RimK-type ligase-like ATP-grasp enzyme [Pedobacter sp. CG_S7]|uniref:ATP-grasp domain-containing protein n=1 Tax=Pedobacter sp. CG_S7 TaxID=3143930 RepID=UPI003390EA67
MTIAYVTYQDKGAYTSTTVEEEDEQLLTFLKLKGLVIETVIWNDPQVEWENYDLAILKSPWDYFDFIDDFYNWLEMLKANKIRLLNPVDIVKWNADKHYLQDIQSAGLKVTESVFITKDQKIDLNDYFEDFKADKFIIKPCVSGGSKNTFKVTKANVAELNLKIVSLLAQEDFIVQPFLAEIERDGEWSFLFFNGKFSHALLKKPKTGDFRVQHSFGGTIHSQVPPNNLLESTQQYVDLFAKDCLYARVDGAVINNKFVLMELELIEPFLFLNIEANSYHNYHQALLELVK